MVADAYCLRLMSLVAEDDPVAVLAATPAALARLIGGLSVERLQRQPAQGKWSISEILSHLADSDIVFAFRLRSALAHDGARLQAFEPDEWAHQFRYAYADARAALGLFTAVRHGTLDLLRRVPAQALNHVARHEEWGEVTVAEMLRIEAGHDRNHLRQVEQQVPGVC